jgi:hypothetical protein
MRRTALKALLLTFLLCCASCSDKCNHGGGNGANNGGNESINKDNAGTPTPKVVFALFDISESVKSDAIRQKYLESFKRILDKIGAGDVIVADAISDNPLGQSSFPINVEFPTFHTDTDNDLIVRKQRKDFNDQIDKDRKQILEKAQALLGDKSRRVLKTKILDSMQLAQQVFKTYQRQKKVLVIFSDMIEESDKYNFQKQRVDDRLTQRIIGEERQARRLPDLNGVQVYVVGAGASENQPQSSAAYNAVENFWLEYFKAAGANLPKEHYGAALLIFNE